MSNQLTIDSLSEVWIQLGRSQLDDATAWHFAPLPNGFSEDDFLLALEPNGERHFLVRTSQARWETSPNTTLSSELRDYRYRTHDGVESVGRFFDIACREKQLNLIFDVVLTSLVEGVQSESSALASIVRGLSKWRKLFKKAFVDKRLNEEQLLGLFGELLVIDECSDENHPFDVSYWRGPLGGEVDFQFEEIDLEVKASTPRQEVVHIHGINQLVPGEGRELYLGVMDMEFDDEGETIGDLIDRVRVKVTDEEAFMSLLSRLGAISDELREKTMIRSNASLIQLTEEVPIDLSALQEASQSGLVARVNLQLNKEPLLRDAVPFDMTFVDRVIEYG